jgi:tetratricopeptide (TPR) repeat protein
VLTRLEIFRLSRGISAEDLNAECSYSRQHILRVRMGRTEPSRDCIAALLSAMRRLSLEDIRAEDIIELTSEDSGPWRRRRQTTFAKEAEIARETRQRALALVRSLSGKSDAWPGRLLAQRDLKREAIVRALILEGRKVRDSDPVRAERLFATAIPLVAEVSDVREEHRALLLGTARVEEANALRHRGRFPESLQLIDIAETGLEGRPNCAHELARAWFVRGSVLLKMGMLSEAIHWLRRAVSLFTAVDDERRVARVRVVEANVLYEQRLVEAACALWRTTLQVFAITRDRRNEGVVWLNLGWCALDMDRAEEARDWLERARERFARNKHAGELARSRWGLALHEARYGDRAAGIAHLREEQQELSRLGLALDAAMVYLDIAETLLLPPTRPREAKALCRRLVPLFREAGANREVLRALAYLSETARANRMTAPLLRRLRGEVRQAAYDRAFTYSPPLDVQ